MPEILDSANKSPKETSPEPNTKEDENSKSLFGVWEIQFLFLFFALILWMKNKKRKNHQDD